MKKSLITIAIIMAFLVGLSVLLYPYVADYYNARNQSKAVASYHNAVKNLDEQNLTQLWEAAKKYNENLRNKQDRYRPTTEESTEYNNLLNISTVGIMGTLEIEKINVTLPIYHGTTEGVLQIGIGHFEGTSLPVGGTGTHAVITGHRGLPSSTLLTNLDRMETGDTFALHILDETLMYQVDNIQIAQPEDLSALTIDPEKDYCTLITCTPYGINTHRMLVRGKRINAPENTEPPPPPHPITPEATKITPTIPILIIIAPIILITATVKLIRHRRKIRN